VALLQPTCTASCRIERWLLAAAAALLPQLAAGQLAELCPHKASSSETVRNEEKRSVAELFRVQPAVPIVTFASPDWREADLQARLAAILRARPRFVAPMIIWAEGADLRRETFSADVGEVRIGASGYQVCVRDPGGRTWFFRNVPVDLWPD
jgi:hypothetical protein